MKALVSRLARVTLAVMAGAVIHGFGYSSAALAEAPWWQIGSETVPTDLSPGGEGQVIVVLTNLGDAPVEGGSSRVSFTDMLPSALTATSITGQVPRSHTPVECAVATLSCEFSGVMYPYEPMTVAIRVKVASGATGTLADQATVEGGGAAKTARKLAIPIDSKAAGFGVAAFEMALFNEDGTAASTAGSHPFQLTTTLAFNQTAKREPVGLAKDLSFKLPPGLVGNPNAVAQCTMVDFFTLVKEANLCPASSVVGVTYVTAYEPKVNLLAVSAPVFNLVPAPGEPARLGFEVGGKIPVVIDTAVRSGGDYGVTATVRDVTETGGILRSVLTLWGVPGDPRHNSARGWECVEGGFYQSEIGRTCPATSEEPEVPFLTSPTSCAVDPQGEPVRFSMEADSWATPGSFLGAEYAWMDGNERALGFEGCAELSLRPTLNVASEEHAASTPTGLAAVVTVSQEGLLEADGRAQPHVRDTTVTLPEGVQLSPSAANGLKGCSEEEMDGPVTQQEHEALKQERAVQVAQIASGGGSDPLVFPDAPAECPSASKVGIVHVKTPLLSHELTGAVYLAAPAPNGEAGRNPFDSLIALYLVAEDKESGVLVKLAGMGEVNERTGQVSTTFANTPQVPFEELRLELFGGPRAALATPARCGYYGTAADFRPWSGGATVERTAPSEEFAVLSGPGRSACPTGALPFGPGFVTRNTSTQAGGFTGFDMELSRPDGDQALDAVSMHLPEGVAALLSSVELCGDAQAAANACPTSSLIGEATAVAGLGPEPYVQRGGKVYITGPYGGAPFGLDIVTPARAGPFDLGYVTVRSKLYIDPSNASVTIVSDPLPTELRGIPLQLKRVIVEVNKAGFEFNPTDCAAPMSIDGTVEGSEGARVGVTSAYPVTDCASLPFTPQLTASAAGHGSKAEGTTFAVTVRSGGVNPGGVAQAGMARVQLQLPKQLSSRLSTLQKACTDTAFNSNPASCDEGSVIGYAAIHTPVLKNPLTGPAYLVSHGGAAFPDVEFVLQGEGIKLVLDGQTDIKEGVTYSKFESTPDAPFTVFETVLPAGPHGVLTPNVAESKHFSLCGETLVMPTTMIAQNGARIEQDTKVTVTGCSEVKSAKARKLSPRQQLRRALASCHRKYRHAKSRRHLCERRAQAHYTRLALAVCRRQGRHAKSKRQACERAARRRLAARSARHAGKGVSAAGASGS
jgi:hypothetical protein